MTTTEEKMHAAFPDLEYTKLVPPSDYPAYIAKAVKPNSSGLLRKGHTRAEGRRPFGCDVIFEQDVPITMRDNITLYTDIFRPADSDINKVPAMIPYGPYGKTGAGVLQYDIMGPYRIGIPLDRTSGYEKFEAPDPGEWCERGYATVNVDARGAGASEGNITFWGQQEAEDIYDTIEWVSKRPWCNGSVAMVGNSWLAWAQINFAARLSHPALKALAPMEGLSDPYRDVLARGGIGSMKHFFDKFLIPACAGPNSIEDITAMLEKRPLYDDYWASKYIPTENIDDVALYSVASYSSMLHSQGSFQTFRTAKTERKWLRVHPFFEWYDIYRPEVNNDLQKFFDRYCKGIENGWEDTPRVRLSLIGFDGSLAETVVERPEKSWPLERQDLRRIYLDAGHMSMSKECPEGSGMVSHAGHDLNASSDFTMYFDQPTELAGYPSVRLWMSCAEADDMDVVVQIRKISSTGGLLDHLNYPCPVPSKDVPNVNIAKYLGPQGFLRASHAVSKVPELCTENETFYQHDRREPVEPGKVVPLDITLWPIGMVFEKGEGIMLRVSGHDMAHPEFEEIRPSGAEDRNVGVHNVHTGGERGSYVVLPVISG